MINLKKNILISGNKTQSGIILNEKLKNGSAVMKLDTVENGYRGEWCSKKCIPVAIQSRNFFKFGAISDVTINEDDSGEYNVEILFGSHREKISISESIDTPSLEFTDLNNDGFYDLIARTDHRPDHGSQVVYISTDNGLVEDKVLSSENGTFEFNPFENLVVFSTRDDCCNKYHKSVYNVNENTFKLKDKFTFDYVTHKGTSGHGGNISQTDFESY